MVISEKNEPLVRIPTILCVTLEDVMLMSWILARQLNYQCVMLCLQYGDIVRYLYLKSVCRSCWMSRKFPPFTMFLSGDSIISSAEITAVGKEPEVHRKFALPMQQLCWRHWCCFRYSRRFLVKKSIIFGGSTTQQQSPPGYAEITCFEGDPCEPSFSTGILDGCCF